MKITQEQQDIVTDVLQNRHVSVTALPGSGKSSVANEIVKQCTDDDTIVMIMFNRSLCDETNHAIQSMELNTRKVKAYTFHGLVGSLLNDTCLDDRSMSMMLPKINAVSDWSMQDFTILIVDEVQDMRPTFFELIRVLVRRICQKRHELRIVLLGDPNQLLYDFYNYNKADSRFLTLGQYLLADTNKFEWSSRKLSQSFRSTPAVANFINAISPDQQQMIPRTCESFEPVDLYIVDVYKDPTKYIPTVVQSYLPEEIMILCPSLNERSPAKAIVRTLTNIGIPVYVQRSGSLMDTNTSTTVSLTDGRVDVKTYHAAKGLQRKLVIVINNKPLFSSMQNSTFVSISRSVEKLVIFHDMNCTSWEDLERLSSSLHMNTKMLRIHITPSTHIPYATRSITNEEMNQPKPSKTHNVDTMFSYIDPSILSPLFSFIQQQIVLPNFPSSDKYSSLFDTKCRDGLHRNMTRVVNNAIHMAIMYQYTHQLPVGIHRLQRHLPNRYSHQLYLRGMEFMDMKLHYVADPWAMENTILKLQAFAMFSLAVDSEVGFEEQLTYIENFGFIMQPEVVNRFMRISQTLEKYIPFVEGITKIERPSRRSIHGSDWKINHCPTIHNKQILVNMVHHPATNDETILSTSVSMACLSITNGIIINIHTGAVTYVTSQSETHREFLKECVRACSLIQEDLSDEIFIKTHKL